MKSERKKKRALACARAQAPLSCSCAFFNPLYNQIVERGTHGELLASMGYYHKMWTLQHAEPNLTEAGLSKALAATEAREKAAAPA